MLADRLLADEIRQAPAMAGVHIATPGAHELVAIDATRRICGCHNCVAARDRTGPAPKPRRIDEVG